MENLKEYMARNALTQKAMAERVGVSRSTLAAILAGTRFPGWRVQIAIEAATHGKIPHAMWTRVRAEKEGIPISDPVERSGQSEAHSKEAVNMTEAGQSFVLRRIANMSDREKLQHFWEHEIGAEPKSDPTIIAAFYQRVKDCTKRPRASRKRA